MSRLAAALLAIAVSGEPVQGEPPSAAPPAAAPARTRGGHWAFQAPVRPPLPAVKSTRWPRNPIDYFILARLEAEGLSPAPEADKVTLLRRLSLDLIGLPPTVEQVDAFLADPRPDAYERQVERLLNSPHYGEKWGRYWLDGARYADSDGFEKDKQRWVWFYRDWVVNALNRDLPYDQFIIEQIAGDLLLQPTQDQLVATGFLRNSMLNEEGGIDPEQFRMEAMFDRLDAIGKSILGLTIQCAQCHDHKYDPLTQEEYYRMFAFLNNSHEANIVVYTPEEQMKRAALFRQIHELEADLRHRTPDWEERLARWEESVQGGQPEWTVVPVQNAGDNSQRYYPQADGSLLAAGYAPTKFTAVFTNTVDLPEIRAFRLEMLTDPNLPAGGPGRSIKGLFGLTEFKVQAEDADNPTNKFWVKWVRATADFSNEEKPLEPLYDDRSGKRRVTGPVEFAIDDDDLTAWGIDAGPGRRNVPRQAVFVANTNVAFPNGTKLTVHLRQMHGGWNSDDNQNMNLGRFRLSVTGASNAVADPLPRAVRDILAIPREQRTPAQTAALFSFWRTTVPEWTDVNARIEALWGEHPEGTTQLVLQEREEPRKTALLRRGDWLKPAGEVQAGVPAFLHPLPAGAPPTRLTFARWLVDRRSPTTARALVNRLWQQYFGTGIVSTSEDLGTQAEAPSHPELLDWLAVEFMEPGGDTKALTELNGLQGGGAVVGHQAEGNRWTSSNDSPHSTSPRPWSLKHLHRLIVTSATYRQSSRVTPQLYARDPYNRLLARGARFRVEAETVRDIALAASGLLNPKLGGPSVYPPAPGFLFQPPASYGPKVWREETGENRYRRALYTFRYRSVPYPMLQTFDAPTGDFSCVRRTRSNTPLQALVSLNEPLFLEAAKALALRTLQAGGATDAERVAYAFRRCVARQPTAQETGELLALLDKQKQHIAEGWVSAYDLAAVDPAHPPPLPPGTTPTQLAAWTAVSRVLLNLDETITKE